MAAATLAVPLQLKAAAPLRRGWATLAVAICCALASPAAPAELAAPAACEGPAQECKAIDGQVAEVEEAEAELLKVSMLQTTLTVGARRSLLGGPPAQGEQPAAPAPGAPGHRATEVQAEGSVEEVVPVAVAPVSPHYSKEVKPGAAAEEAIQPTQVKHHAATEEEAEEDPAQQSPSFFQTDLLLTKGAAANNQTDSQLGVANNTQLPPHGVALLGTETVHRWDCSGLDTELPSGKCAPGFTPLQMHIQLDFLRSIGFYPLRGPALLQGEPAAEAPEDPVMALLASDRVHPIYFSSHVSKERLIIALYMFFYISCMSMMYYWMIAAPSAGSKGAEYGNSPCKRTADTDVEEEAWRQGCLSWLAVSWASPWVARWGHSFEAARTKIKPSELPQVGGREHQSREACDVFERYWQEEIDAVGEESASLARVIVRIWTARTMAYLMTLLVVQVLMGQIYSVFLIEHSMKYFYWLQDYVEHHGETPDLTVPLMLSIVAFLICPFSYIMFSSICSSIACRLDQRTCGGLAIALFRKSQRLPSTGQQAEGEAKGEDKQADLLNLVNYDVNTNLVGSYLTFALCTTSFVALIVLTALLWMRLKLATLCAIGCAVPVVVFSLCLMSGLAGAFSTLQSAIDQRIPALREVLYGIRVVKGYAWEEAMEEKVNALRGEELKGLKQYFHYLGGFLGVFIGFPRVLILSGLWGYSAIYGHHDVATIFTCMQILSSLRWSCDIFIKSFAQAVIVQPSIKRVESYLKLPEAPVLLPEKSPDWVELWSETNGAAAALPDGSPPKAETPFDGSPPKPGMLVARGSYKWSEDGSPALQGLSLSVPRGQLVAVLGSVGSGKSTLLQAVLGELYPDLSQEAGISRPEVIAYCSQVPHIAEGTLRENVLFGQPYEQERYDEAIRAASLTADLAVLPGGDGVPIGSRGITLSGGQKARVSMARAAYHQGSELVIIDDPFAAVDAPTAGVILDKLLLGPLMKNRTRLVSLQPDSERLRKFDHVVIMERGRIKEQGTPEEVMQREAYTKLLSSHTEVFESDGKAKAKDGGSSPASRKVDQPQHNKLREEETENRPTMEMMTHVCSLGGWANLTSASVIFCLTIYLYLLCDLVLARWTNAMVVDPTINDWPYLTGYLFWLGSGLCAWVVCWYFGECFTLSISSALHNMVLKKVLRAPIDRFFDKHPVGRLLNRMSTDLMVVDLNLYVKGTGGCSVIYQTLVPIIYVHTIMPWFITFAAIPFYFVMGVFCVRFWNTSVPLRYCMTSARSDVSSLCADMVGNKVVVRAFQDQERMTLEMCDAVDNQLKAGLLGERVLRRWLVNRIVFMWSFYTTTMYMVGLLSTAHIGAGTLGICLTNLLLLESNIEAYLDTATGAQFEFIALARLHDYLSVPQEKAMRKEDDARLRNFTVRIPRKDLGALVCANMSETCEVRRYGVPLLKATLDDTALMVAGATGSASVMPRLADLCPSCPGLRQADSWHRIISVNDAVRDAKAMAQELCRAPRLPIGKSKGMDQEEVVMEVQSGWLLEGAQVQIEGIKAGYADVPRDVLKGIDLVFERKAKVAIAGTTGCGKSSLLLVFLRVLEPRAGRIVLNGVDIADVGLATLRSSIGLVPQDPVLFSGSLRHNLDPFGTYTDGRVWEALRRVQLTALVEEWPLRLQHPISDEGGNLSFGQRQLVCLARMLLRQPGLLLLDEATSAIEPHTQQLVQNTIKSAFPSSTIVAVAHRLETVLDFDHVVVLDHGAVAEQGPVKELSERKDGIFRQMLAAKGAW